MALENVLLFFGDRYQIKKAIQGHIDNLPQEDQQWVEKYDVNKADYDSVVTKLRSSPLFSNGNTIVLQGFSREFFSQLADDIDGIHVSNTLLIAAENIDKRNKLYKLLQKHNRTKEYEPVSTDDKKALIKWCEDCAIAQGSKFKRGAASLLIDKAGGHYQANNKSKIVANLQKLESEIQKLLLYVDDKPIGRADIDVVVDDYGDRNIFAINDAISNGDTVLALKLFRQIITTIKKESIPTTVNYLIYNLLSMHKVLLYMRGILNKGAVEAQLPKYTAEVLHSSIPNQPKYNDDGSVKASRYSVPQLYAIKSHLKNYNIKRVFSCLASINKTLEGFRTRKSDFVNEMELLIIILCLSKK